MNVKRTQNKHKESSLLLLLLLLLLLWLLLNVQRLETTRPSLTLQTWHLLRLLLYCMYVSMYVARYACIHVVERSLMVRWVVGSILHGVDPLSYFSFQPVLHDWWNKGRGMCYHVCGMVHINEPLLLIDKSSLCGGSGFPFSLSEWSLTICLTPYNRR